MKRWDHQLRAVDELLAAIAWGEKRVLVTSPTGGGKSVIMADLARDFLDRGKRVILYTNRRLLIEQFASVLTVHGFDFGIRAAGHAPDRNCPFQIASVQTEAARSMKGKEELFPADLVLCDEAHLQGGNTVQELQTYYVGLGAAWVGFTATPIDLGLLYSKLIVAGTNSELRKCGALVPCTMYGPDEPDLKAYKKELAEGKDLSEKKASSAMGGKSKHLFGRVFEWFEKLNPDHRPTILFAPGVDESMWFAEQFTERGIPAAHIDGKNVWVNGEQKPTTPERRQEILDGSREGSISVLCNRFVLREGIDAPWLAHGIFATVFGSLQTYLQSGGRLLRAHPQLASVTLQDHGGNWWRHGSLNADRSWNLDYTALMYAGIREDRLREKLELEPARCPQCAQIIGSVRPGMKCVCGHVFGERKTRPVIMSDGEARELVGDVFRPRPVMMKKDTLALWTKVYWQAKNSNMTFRQAIGFFVHQNHYEPPPDLKYMPKIAMDRYRLVSEIDRDRLH